MFNIILILHLLFSIFFPFVFSNNLPVGVDANPFTTSDLQRMKDAGVNIATTGNLLWKNYEPEIGRYNEEYFNSYKDRVNRIISYGIEPIVIIHGAKECRPLTLEEIPYFINFVNKTIRELDNVKYFQIWNEPDYSLGEVDYYGCWGLEYKDRFKYMMNLIDAPNKYISIGIAQFPEFTEGMKFDILNVHYYQYWNPSYTYNSIIPYLDKIDKPVFITEANLIKDGESNLIYEQDKCDFMRNIYEESKNRAGALIYYSWSSGWKNANIRDLPAEQCLSVITP